MENWWKLPFIYHQIPTLTVPLVSLLAAHVLQYLLLAAISKYRSLTGPKCEANHSLVWRYLSCLCYLLKYLMYKQQKFRYNFFPLTFTVSCFLICLSPSILSLRHRPEWGVVCIKNLLSESDSVSFVLQSFPGINGDFSVNSKSVDHWSVAHSPLHKKLWNLCFRVGYSQYFGRNWVYSSNFGLTSITWDEGSQGELIVHQWSAVSCRPHFWPWILFEASWPILIKIYIRRVIEKLPLLKFHYFENYKRNLDSYFTFRVSGQLQTHLEQ